MYIGYFSHNTIQTVEDVPKRGNNISPSMIRYRGNGNINPSMIWIRENGTLEIKKKIYVAYW